MIPISIQGAMTQLATGTHLKCLLHKLNTKLDTLRLLVVLLGLLWIVHTSFKLFAGQQEPSQVLRSEPDPSTHQSDRPFYGGQPGKLAGIPKCTVRGGVFLF